MIIHGDCRLQKQSDTELVDIRLTREIYEDMRDMFKTEGPYYSKEFIENFWKEYEEL